MNVIHTGWPCCEGASRSAGSQGLLWLPAGRSRQQQKANRLLIVLIIEAVTLVIAVFGGNETKTPSISQDLTGCRSGRLSSALHLKCVDIPLERTSHTHPGCRRGLEI